MVKENIEHIIKWQTYTICYLICIVSVPLMHDLLYEPSKEWIRFIIPYRTPFRTTIM